MSRLDATCRDSDEPPAEESPRLRKKIESLESELIDQKIANRAKTQYIERLESERSTFIDRLQIQSRQIGQLETRLELQGGPEVGQLPEPKGQVEETASESRDPSEREPQPPTHDPVVTNDLSHPEDPR